MSRPGWLRTALPLLCGAGRLVEQLATSTPTRAGHQLEGLAEMIARIT
jgi:hypothetical protein